MPTTLPLAPNVPVAISLRYIDVWPNDMSKNNGKGFGASLALTGTVDGQDRRVYPKGFLDRNLGVLAAAGVIAPSSYDHDPAKKYSIPVLTPHVVVCMEQPAGERWPSFVVRDARGGQGAGDGRATSAAPAAPAAPVAPPDPYRHPTPLETPRELAHHAPTSAPTPAPSETGGKLQQAARQYASTLTWVLDHVVPKLADRDIPCDAAGINAVVATILIRAEHL